MINFSFRDVLESLKKVKVFLVGDMIIRVFIKTDSLLHTLNEIILEFCKRLDLIAVHFPVDIYSALCNFCRPPIAMSTGREYIRRVCACKNS